MVDQPGLAKSMFEFLWTMPDRLFLLMTGRRHHAKVLEEWSWRCPLCGGSYQNHDELTIGGAPAPAEDLLEAVAAGKWGSVKEIVMARRSNVPVDVVAICAMRCPRRREVAVFVYSLPEVGFSLPLISRHTLGEDAVDAFERVFSDWSPSTVDVLKKLRV